MAFACVISLKNIIERLLNSSKISLPPASYRMIEFTYKEAKSLENTLKKLDSSSKRMDRKRVNALDAEIREHVSEFEHLLEYHISLQISELDHHPSKFSIDLLHLTPDVNIFVETSQKMEEEYVIALDTMVPEEEEEEEEDDDEGESGKSKIIGLSDLLPRVIKNFTRPVISTSMVYCLLGMAGTGKTALAKEIFDDPFVSSHYECFAWVRVGRKFRLDGIPRSILAQVDGDNALVGREGEDDEQATSRCLYNFLKDKRYLIVLDDVWEAEVWECLRCCFPESGVVLSRILITTRLEELYEHIDTTFYTSSLVNVRLLNSEESWDLFREKVFGGEWCPPKLEEAGKKIAKNCDGLPLTIIKVAKLLSNAGITLDYWNEVAEDEEHPVFENVYGEMSKVVSPSYDYLPQHLKPCFLYLGVFPRGYEFSRSKLIDMWIAEGFLVPVIRKAFEESGTECLVELVSNSLVIVCEKSTIVSREIQTCRLHSSLWHFAKLEVQKNKFFTVLNSRAEGFQQGLKGQRRLSVHNNILLGIKDVYGAIEDGCALSARSLLCLGPYHRHPLPLCFGLRFLRMLRALSIRLYEFPKEVLELVQLRYLALTHDGNLPPSVSKLFNLEFLIIHRHLSIKPYLSHSYLPVEIWDMHELMHLHVMGSELPESTSLAFLKNLQTLLDVGIGSCTKRVLRKLSNLRKLGIRIELVPDNEIEPLSCLNHISRLHKLESLKCIIVNPEMMTEPVAPQPAPLLVFPSTLRKLLKKSLKCIIGNTEMMAPVAPQPAPLLVFPSTLRKLHLSGLCCAWKHTDAIGSLPNLQVLKLQCYAFQGPTWEVKEFEFPKLRFLVIEDADLVEWRVGCGSFSRLRNLSIRHCYNLEKFHWDFSYYFKVVEVVDSNPAAETFFDQIKDRRGRRFVDVSYHSSWDDGKLKSS